MHLLRSVELTVKDMPWLASRSLTGWANRAAIEFYARLAAGGYEPDRLVNVLPRHKLIYVGVPKAASTRIRTTLARIEGRLSRSLKRRHRGKYRGPYGPRSMTVGAFFRLATDPDTLRFSFVRNPYARAVSCWADKFAGKPLVPGDPYVDCYLAMRKEIDGKLPAGADRTLSFAEFVTFAAATASICRDIHLQTQDDILTTPGIALDLIGRVENFNADFARVLDHLGASAEIRREATVAVNQSNHDDWSDLYNDELADRLYRAYERDFDRFRYPRFVTQPLRLAG